MIHTYAYVDLYFYLCSDRSVVLPLPQQHRDSFGRLCTRCFNGARVEPDTGINAWQNCQRRIRPQPLGGVGISPPCDNGFLDRSNFIRSIRWIKIPFSFTMASSFPLVLPPPFLPFLLACIHAFFYLTTPFLPFPPAPSLCGERLRMTDGHWGVYAHCQAKGFEEPTRTTPKVIEEKTPLGMRPRNKHWQLFQCANWTRTRSLHWWKSVRRSDCGSESEWVNERVRAGVQHYNSPVLTDSIVVARQEKAIHPTFIHSLATTTFCNHAGRTFAESSRY